MLRLMDLSRSFGGFVAVRSVSLDVAAGEKHAIIGPNGAGKTTLFNLITGHLRPTGGEVEFEGARITGLPPHAVVKRGIGRSFQRINIYPRLSVWDNVHVARLSHHGHHFALFARGATMHRPETRAILEMVDLSDDAEAIAGTMSYGKQKQLELAIALALDPKLLLLDEPTAGMSPAETRDCVALVDRIARARGLTLLFTEHDMDVVFRVADRISVLHHGEIIASGAPEAVRADPDVRRIYLGEADHAAA